MPAITFTLPAGKPGRKQSRSQPSRGAEPLVIIDKKGEPGRLAVAGRKTGGPQGGGERFGRGLDQGGR
jgi:hypothetical protein